MGWSLAAQVPETRRIGSELSDSHDLFDSPMPVACKSGFTHLSHAGTKTEMGLKLERLLMIRFISKTLQKAIFNFLTVQKLARHQISKLDVFHIKERLE